ncbi:tropomyosin-like [Papaver somniferum]|uniref:tropomyosin-like n=1 Tax=Papaver somniferum TaxID=3469 RepID=UPI000E6FACFD|nr:tropomyosin-like [Papaver somniferum]
MESFMDTYADFLPRLLLLSICKKIDVGCTLFKFYRDKCTHLSTLLKRTRQDHALSSAQQPSSSDADSTAKISLLERDLRKTQRSLEACLLAIERATNAAKVSEDGRKAADSALAAESSKAIEIGRLENVCQVLSSETASLRIDVEDLRTERDTLVEDLDSAEEQLVGANANINRLEGQVSSLETAHQFDAAAKFKAASLQEANDHLSAQMMELRQKSASNLEVQSSQIKVQFERSSIDHINTAFAKLNSKLTGSSFLVFLILDPDVSAFV